MSVAALYYYYILSQVLQGYTIIVRLYRDLGDPVKDFLPPDYGNTRENVLYTHLFDAFDKINGKPSEDDLTCQKLEQEAAKQKEFNALLTGRIIVWLVCIMV